MNRLSLWVVLMVLGWAAPLRAQDSAPPLPPYVNAIPENSKWLITVTATPTPPVPGEAPPPPALKSQTITVVGDTRRDVRAWDNGVETETWYFKGARLEESIQTRQIYLNDDHYSSSAGIPPPRSWDRLQWLAADNFHGRVTEQGVACLEFRRELAGSPQRALINAETRLPVVLQEGTTTFRYQQQAAPTERLTLSPKFAAKWSQYLAASKKLIVNRPPR